MKKNYDSNENLIFTKVRYNSRKKKLTCNRKNQDVAAYIDEVNYFASLNDDAVDCEFKGTIKVENFW